MKRYPQSFSLLPTADRRLPTALMLGRADMNSVPGGDTIQMMETAAALRSRGVEVAIAPVNALPPDPQCDIVHVFNLDQVEPALLALEKISMRETKLVVSTIYWHHTGHWYGEAVNTRKIWRLADRSMGSKHARALYESWQNLKIRHGAENHRIRQMLSFPAQLLPNSQTEVDHLQSVFGHRSISSKITIVPNGVRRELFEPRPEPDEKFLQEYGLRDFVLEVARIQQAKNQLLLIEALFDTDVPIVFLGQESPYETTYVERCRALAKKRGNTYFVGPRSAREVAGICALAAVHVLPSWRETPGLASLEAAAAGCRVVSTRAGSAHEYLGDMAWYCDPGDKESIRKAVQRALEAPPQERMRRRILEHYTWDKAAEITLHAYCRVLAAARNRQESSRG